NDIDGAMVLSGKVNSSFLRDEMGIMSAGLRAHLVDEIARLSAAGGSVATPSDTQNVGLGALAPPPYAA
ncbi:hypothetical protein HK405_004588, partial [Cladochytrium tenue]